MKRTLELKLFFLALLCAVAQGALAQVSVWDGKSKEPPVIVEWPVYAIKNAAQFAWLIDCPRDYMSGKIYYRLDTDLDMGDQTWTPIGYINGEVVGFYSHLLGQGHTVRINISGVTENYQGLFAKIGYEGSVDNLHVIGKISCSRSRLVGGIAGENDGGSISNCWVSADVSSDWKESASAYTAKVGGIVGENHAGTIEYCCVTGDVTNNDADVGGIAGYNCSDNGGGIIRHCTFYGTRNSTHSQDNKYVGDQDATMENMYDSFNQGEYDAAGARALYRYALKYPYAINVSTEGYGTVEVSAGGENNIPGWRKGETITLTCKTGMVKSIEIKDSGDDTVSLQGQSHDGTMYWFVMPKGGVKIKLVFVTPGWLNHAGTEADPISIGSSADWDGFANYVSNVTSFSGKYVKLNADISASTMAGSSDHKFQGTFLGNNKTLTLNLSATGNDCAPFRYIDGATICDLKIAGTVNTSAKFGASIAAHNSGTSTITNCHSSVTIGGTISGDGTHGGFVAMNEGDATLVFAGCTFTGGMTGSADYNGGFVGWNAGSTIHYTHCIFAPAELTMGASNSCTFNRNGRNNITQSYFTRAFGEAQGTKAIAINKAPANLGSQVQDYGMVKAYENGLLYDGKYYTAISIPGSGTEANPCLIGTADQWNDFTGYIANGYTFSGEFVKLAGNISISTMAGTDNANSFQGTFDGDGHTLTVNYNTSEPRTAPFRHVKNAVIRNLTVAGTITTSAQFAAGIVGESHGSLTLTGCRSSVAINSSVQGDGTHGGLVSTLSGKDNAITIEGCVFDGSFATTNGTSNCGGFIGWPVYNRPTIRHSLMMPGSVAAGMLKNTFSRWHTTYMPTIEKCFFIATENLPEDQGSAGQGVSTIPDQFGKLEKDYGLVKVYTNGIQYDGMYYLESALILPGSGTESDPYTIGSTADWDNFAKQTGSGCHYTNQYIKLTSDISVTAMADTFEGTFDGNGHTLTVNIDLKDWGLQAAPIRNTRNATIKNLKTAGTITSNYLYMAGIVGNVKGNTTIENCSSSIALHSGDITIIGGLVACVNSDVTLNISGCAFTGSLTIGGSYKLLGGGIVGISNQQTNISIRDCLFAPSELATQWSKFYTFVTDEVDKFSVTGCYYTQDYGTVQGTKAIALASAPVSLGEQVKDYGMLKAYEGGIFFDGKYYVDDSKIGLDDKADNGSVISELDGITVDIALTGCTLYKDGAWNTICLPFNLTLAGSPLDGAVARPLSSASISGLTLNLAFGDAVTELKAGTPYIIKWASGDNIVNPQFIGVTIDATDRSFDNGANGDKRVRFIGVYKSIAFDGEDKSVLLLGGGNTLYHPVSGAGVGALRAYFKIGDSATKATISVKGSVLTVK